MGQNQLPAYVGLVPMLPVSDVARTIAFYAGLGFEVGNSHAPEANDAPVWAWLFCGQAHLMVNRSEGPIVASHATAAIWLYTRDVEAAHRAFRSRGLDVGDIDHPFYNRGGEFHIHDPDGYAVFVAHAD